MIGKDQIAESIRYADARIEEHGDMRAYWAERGVDVEGLSYVAMQRGLRAVMRLKGINPNQPKPVTIRLTREEEMLQTMIAAAFMDGFAAHENLKDKP
jgi:hypothetical protein